MEAKRIELQTLEAAGTGKRAYEIGSYIIFGEDDNPIDEGTYTVAWEREEGAWKLRRDMWSSRRPMREGPAQSEVIVPNQTAGTTEDIDRLHELFDAHPPGSCGSSAL